MLFNWIRTGVRNAILGGTQDALEALGIRPEADADGQAARLLLSRLQALPGPEPEANGHDEEAIPSRRRK